MSEITLQIDLAFRDLEEFANAAVLDLLKDFLEITTEVVRVFERNFFR